jgi:hypothetical protein
MTFLVPFFPPFPKVWFNIAVNTITTCCKLSLHSAVQTRDISTLWFGIILYLKIRKLLTLFIQKHRGKTVKIYIIRNYKKLTLQASCWQTQLVLQEISTSLEFCFQWLSLGHRGPHVFFY